MNHNFSTSAQFFGTGVLSKVHFRRFIRRFQANNVSGRTMEMISHSRSLMRMPKRTKVRRSVSFNGTRLPQLTAQNLVFLAQEVILLGQILAEKLLNLGDEGTGDAVKTGFHSGKLTRRNFAWGRETLRTAHFSCI
jgi:hypothetical protein